MGAEVARGVNVGTEYCPRRGGVTPPACCRASSAAGGQGDKAGTEVKSGVGRAAVSLHIV